MSQHLESDSCNPSAFARLAWHPVKNSSATLAQGRHFPMADGSRSQLACLQDNCGSVTPGVLRSCVPHLTQIQALALGLSYSLGNDDVFAFVQGLPNLKDLDLRYYLVSLLCAGPDIS